MSIRSTLSRVNLISVVSMLSLAAFARAGTLFSDTFDRGSTTNLSSSTVGMGGSLGPLTYQQTSRAEIASNVLSLGRGDPTGDQAFADHDFVDPAIAAAGGFVVEMDLTPSQSVDYLGDANWAAVSLGYTRANAVGAFWKVDRNNAFGILLRSSAGTKDPSRIQMFSNGQDIGSPLFDTSPTLNETYHLKLTVTPTVGQSLFTPGNVALVDVAISGNLDSVAGIDTYVTSRTVSWINNSNYVVMEGIRPDSTQELTSTFDNLAISTLPEPSVAVFGAVVIWAGRRRRGAASIV